MLIPILTFALQASSIYLLLATVRTPFILIYIIYNSDFILFLFMLHVVFLFFSSLNDGLLLCHPCFSFG